MDLDDKELADWDPLTVVAGGDDGGFGFNRGTLAGRFGCKRCLCIDTSPWPSRQSSALLGAASTEFPSHL